MSKTLQQVLGGRNLTRLIQSVAGGVPDDLLPPGLMTPTLTIEGDRGTYQKVETTRSAARRAPYGSKSRTVGQQGITETPFVAIHTIENITIELTTLMNLMAEGSMNKQRLGEQTVARQVRNLMQRFRNLRMSSLYSALAKGAIYFDGQGAIQTSSSTVDLDFQIPSGNQTQFNTESGGGGDTILSANWNTAATDIIGQIKLLKKTARKRTGLPLRHCFYGSNILDYLLTNTKLKELINRSESRRSAAAAGEIPDGFLGFTWWPIEQAFTDIGGTLTDWFSDDALVFIPEVSTDWYDFAEGTFPVPQGIAQPGTSIEQMIASVSLEQGMFSYAEGTIDPPSVKQVAGDTFMPLITNPNAIFTGTAPTS